MKDSRWLRKAWKTHTCLKCGRDIKFGEQYHWYRFKICVGCWDTMEEGHLPIKREENV